MSVYTIVYSAARRWPWLGAGLGSLPLAQGRRKTTEQQVTKSYECSPTAFSGILAIPSVVELQKFLHAQKRFPSTSGGIFPPTYPLHTKPDVSYGDQYPPRQSQPAECSGREQVFRFSSQDSGDLFRRNLQVGPQPPGDGVRSWPFGISNANFFLQREGSGSSPQTRAFASTTNHSAHFVAREKHAEVPGVRIGGNKATNPNPSCSSKPLIDRRPHSPPHTLPTGPHSPLPPPPSDRISTLRPLHPPSRLFAEQKSPPTRPESASQGRNPPPRHAHPLTDPCFPHRRDASSRASSRGPGGGRGANRHDVGGRKREPVMKGIGTGWVLKHQMLERVDAILALPPSAKVDDVLRGQVLGGKFLGLMLSSLRRHGESARVVEVLQFVDKGGYTLNNTHFTIALSACRDMGVWEAAVALFALLKAKGIQPDVISYNALMSACERGCQWELSLAVLNELDPLAPMVEESYKYAPIGARHRSLSEWLGGRSEDNSGDDKVQSDRPAHAPVCADVQTYSAAISACQKGGQWEVAMKVFARMLEAGLQPDAVAYSALISALAGAGEVGPALEALAHMRAHKVRPNTVTYSALMAVCARAKEAALALELFRHMHQEGLKPNAITYNSLLQACAVQGMWEDSVDLFGQMTRAGFRPDNYTFSSLCKACEEAGEWCAYPSLFAQMTAAGVKVGVGTYHRAAVLCARDNTWEGTRAAWEAMQEAGAVAPLDEELYEGVCHAYRALGDPDRALEIATTWHLLTKDAHKGTGSLLDRMLPDALNEDVPTPQ